MFMYFNMCMYFVMYVYMLFIYVEIFSSACKTHVMLLMYMFTCISMFLQREIIYHVLLHVHVTHNAHT